ELRGSAHVTPAHAERRLLASTTMTWLWVAIMVVLDGAAGVAGALGPGRWGERYSGPLLRLSGGALRSSGVGGILPEAVARHGLAAIAWALPAVAVLARIEWLTARRSHHERRPIVPLSLLGSDALHNISDGMAIAAAFLVAPRFGFITSLAVIVHEV